MTFKKKTCIIRSRDSKPIRNLIQNNSGLLILPPARSLTAEFSKNMRKINGLSALVSVARIVFVCAAAAFNAAAQMPTPEQLSIEEDYTWWYISLAVLLAGLAAAFALWLKSKKSSSAEPSGSVKLNGNGSQSNEVSLDFDQEIEWLRRNKNLVDKKSWNNKKEPVAAAAVEVQAKKIEDLDSLPLPVFDFAEIKKAESYNLLPLSNDPSLISAIEQAQDEDEEDEEIRDLTLRILAAFRTRNSVEALTQIALYDLSSALRSKAVSILADFDHESVFEPILLACADPTREVRAAAARALSRLSFERADAWTRMLETRDEGRIRQAARAAAEGGFIQRSFERLVHRDPKQAYESLVILSLLVRAKETDPIMDALKNHSDDKVRKAILHLLRVTKDQTALVELYNLLDDKKVPSDVKQDIDKTIKEISLVMV